jgi:hypothetical protein
VSNLHERKEKNCLNCGTTVIGKYCHSCGQENIEPEESVWDLVAHFFSDITHFDGNFFSSVKSLILRPGFLSKEYVIGKRASYLNPVRMYLFTSFVFFLIFFSYIESMNQSAVKLTYNGKTLQQIQQMSPQDYNNFTSLLNNGKPINREDFSHYIDSINKNKGLNQTIFNKGYKSREEYDSIVRIGVVKQNWATRKFAYKEIELNQKYQGNANQFINDLVEAFLHSFPQLLFVSLPFAAFLLKLLYIRQKRFYYVGHAVFTMHFYIFLFIVQFGILVISRLADVMKLSWLEFVNAAIILASLFYLYKAMRNFYQQRRGKTILKYGIFLLAYLFVILFLIIIFFFVSIFKI